MMAVLSFVLAAQGLATLQPQAGGAMPPRAAVGARVRSLDRSALQRLLGDAKAGGDADPVVSLSTAQMSVPGRASLRFYQPNEVDAEAGFFGLAPYANHPSSVTVYLKGLKKGTSYLVVMNCDVANVRERAAYGTPDQGYGTLELDAPDGPANIPCLFKATDKEQIFTMTFEQRTKGGASKVTLWSVDVHAVK